MAKIKTSNRRYLVPTLSEREQESVEKLAAAEGVPLTTLIRRLLLDRLRAYKAEQKSGAKAAARGSKPSRKESAGDRTAHRTASRATKGSLPGRLAAARRDAPGSAGAAAKDGPVQHSLPMSG
jgi:hypothetical protein